MVQESRLGPDEQVVHRPFAWGMAVLHALAFVVLFYLSSLVATALTHADPETSGRLAGFLSPPTFAIGFILSWVIQMRRPWIGYSVALLWCVLPFPSLLLGAQRQEAFSGEERAPLAVVGTDLVNKALGFSLPFPGDAFVATPVSSDELAQLPPSSFMWLFTNSQTQETISVMVTKQNGSFNAFFTGLARGVTSGLASAGFEILADSVSAEPDAGMDVRARQSRGLSLYMWCTVSRPGTARGLAVCISATSPEIERLEYLKKGVLIH